jgi:hypothetical protein
MSKETAVTKILKWAEPKANTGKTPYKGLYSPAKKVSGTQRKQG